MAIGQAGRLVEELHWVRTKGLEQMRMRVLHSLPDGQEMQSWASEMGGAGPLYSDVMVDLAR